MWPALTEAVYLVQRWPSAQMELLNLVESGALRILPFGRDDVARVKALMTKYRDLPMDLADAALVRVAEREGIRTIFTIDRRDFSLYRPLGLGRFKIIPGPRVRSAPGAERLDDRCETPKLKRT